MVSIDRIKRNDGVNGNGKSDLNDYVYGNRFKRNMLKHEYGNSNRWNKSDDYSVSIAEPYL